MGPITRTFNIPCKDVIDILATGKPDVVNRVDITEYPEETRATIYNLSQIDHPSIPILRQASRSVQEWDLEPQYGEWSAKEYVDND